MGMEKPGFNTEEDKILELQKKLAALQQKKAVLDARHDGNYIPEKAEPVAKPLEKPALIPKKHIEKRAEIQEVMEKNPGIRNKRKSFRAFHALALAGLVGVSTAVAVGGGAKKSFGNTEPKLDRTIENQNEQSVSIEKVSNFGRVSEYVDTNYYQNLENSQSYTAELSYLERADTLEKGGVVGNNIVIMKSADGKSYDAYLVDYQNRIKDSVKSIAENNYENNKNLNGEDFTVSDSTDAQTKLAQAGITLPDNFQNYLDPLEIKIVGDNGVQENRKIPTRITVMPKTADLNGKVSVLAPSISGETTVVGLSKIEFQNKIKSHITGEPSIFSKIKKAITANESSGDYQIECSVGNACGRYQIIPSWHFNKVGLDPNSKEDRDEFLHDPSIQDLTYSIIWNDLMKAYNNNVPKAIADYFHGSEGARVYGTPEGDQLKDALGTSVNAYVHHALKIINSESGKDSTQSQLLASK